VGTENGPTMRAVADRKIMTYYTKKYNSNLIA
jgi:hypothetical protein